MISQIIWSLQRIRKSAVTQLGEPDVSQFESWPMIRNELSANSEISCQQILELSNNSVTSYHQIQEFELIRESAVNQFANISN